MTLEEAIDTATEECIKKGLLVKYLKLYRTEVRNMWATEWKMEDALEVRAREVREDTTMETAKELLTLGVDVDIISQATKLSVDTILRLQSTRK